MTKREMLNRFIPPGARLGRSLPRGYISPDLSHAKEFLTVGVDLIRAVMSGELDVDAIARGEFDDAAREFLEERGIPI